MHGEENREEYALCLHGIPVRLMWCDGDMDLDMLVFLGMGGYTIFGMLDGIH